LVSTCIVASASPSRRISRERPSTVRKLARTCWTYSHFPRCGVGSIAPATPSSFGSPPSAMNGSAEFPG
jgi:hypothetical protein